MDSFSDEHKQYLLGFGGENYDSLTQDEICYLMSVESDGTPVDESITWEWFARDCGYLCAICQKLPLCNEYGFRDLECFDRIHMWIVPVQA